MQLGLTTSRRVARGRAASACSPFVTIAALDCKAHSATGTGRRERDVSRSARSCVCKSRPSTRPVVVQGDPGDGKRRRRVAVPRSARPTPARVASMMSTFSGDLDQPIGGWDTSKVDRAADPAFHSAAGTAEPAAALPPCSRSRGDGGGRRARRPSRRSRRVGDECGLRLTRITCTHARPHDASAVKYRSSCRVQTALDGARARRQNSRAASPSASHQPPT